MNNSKSENSKHQSALYEIKEISDYGVVYQRVITPKGRNKKEVEKEVQKLPTATLHSWTQEEYDKLKELEKKIYSEMDFSEEPRSFKDRFLEFMEI